MRRHHTAPSRAGAHKKRDVPAVWDLFALDDRATAMRDSHDGDSSSTTSISRQASHASLSSLVSEPSASERSFDDKPPSFGSRGNSCGGGSWPRVRKQRTSECSSMSLFEVKEALSIREDPPEWSPMEENLSEDLSNLASLVSAEKAALAAAPEEHVSIESFVDAVFYGIASSAAPAAGPAVPAAVPPPAAATTVPPAALATTTIGAMKSHKPTANDLKLLEAMAADEAAAAAREATIAAARRAHPTIGSERTRLGDVFRPPPPHATLAEREGGQAGTKGSGSTEEEELLAMLGVEAPRAGHMADASIAPHYSSPSLAPAHSPVLPPLAFALGAPVGSDGAREEACDWWGAGSHEAFHDMASGEAFHDMASASCSGQMSPQVWRALPPRPALPSAPLAHSHFAQGHRRTAWLRAAQNACTARAKCMHCARKVHALRAQSACAHLACFWPCAWRRPRIPPQALCSLHGRRSPGGQ